MRYNNDVFLMKPQSAIVLPMILRTKHIIFAFSIVFLLGFSSTQRVHAQTSPIESIEETLGVENLLLIKASISQALEVGRLGNHKFYDPPGMKAFYQSREFESVWLESSFFKQRKAESLLAAFEDSWKHGLNPNNYFIKDIRRLMDEAKGAERFQLDLLLSDALVRYGRDLSGMRVEPRSIGQLSKYWRQPLRGIDILDHVANSSDASKALEIMAPQGALYKSLQKELVRLYITPPEDSDTAHIYLSGLIRPGDSHKAILKVRERLGFNPDTALQGAYYYDDELAQAVMTFQKDSGLTPDGIIGSQTVKVMNMTRNDRINQILVNLERLRWVEPNKPSRYVMVNVPAAILWAVENNNVVLEMPVVVGRPKRPTNIFTTEITGIRFNPTWTVPPTIKKEDYLPKLQEDPYYLFDRGIELIDSENMTVDPGMINWSEKTWKEVNAMRMVQGSGSSNPLGLVRVIMNNPYNIYLHDTPTKSYFARSNRALSSGCVRMAEPLKFADFVLEKNDGWSAGRRDKLLARGRQADIPVEHPLPVYILYQTVWLGDRGQIVYGRDLYNHDATLLKELRKIGGLVFPVKAEDTQTAYLNGISPAAGIDLSPIPQ